jgi:WD40 repeat protein
MWGDAYLWDVGTSGEIKALVEDAERREGAGVVTVRRKGGLRRSVGHKVRLSFSAFLLILPKFATLTFPTHEQGSIFSVSFSPPSDVSPPCLLTASDDRTLQIFPLPTSFDTFFPLENGSVPSTITEDDEDKKREVLWGHDGKVWRGEWLEGGRGIVSVGEVRLDFPI